MHSAKLVHVSFLPGKRAGTPLVTLLLLGCPFGALAQLPATGVSGNSRPVPLPQSGRGLEPGAASTQQSTVQGGVNTLNSSVQVGGDLQGSVAASNVPPGPVSLTLADAVKRGLEANLGTIAANDAVRAARAQRIQMLSAMLPNIAINASETVTQVNLAAYGFTFNLPPGFNFSIPSVVGPFSYSQLQGTFALSVLDFVARRNYQAGKESERASVLAARDMRELVVLAVTGTYLQAITTAARAESQRAQVANAEAVHHQAEVRKAAGTNARIDVMRTLVELETQQQRLTSLQSDLRKQKIVLARLIGLPLDREITLTQSLNPGPVGVPDADATIRLAIEKRADLAAAEAQVRAAERAVAAGRAERLPSVSVNGDYGALGRNPTSAHGVFSVTAGVNVPVWTGGRIKGEIEQAEATLHQRQAELADQRGRVEQDVRTALIELETALGQVRVADSNRGYARETLRESTDRFNLGVANTVEVVQAQEQVAAAESDYIASLFSLNLARITLARASGEAETQLPDLLK